MIRNLIGWKTNRKIIVIESDDWGSFRFKNQKIRNLYIKEYNPQNWMHYNDCFESYDDLKALESTLKKFKDSKNNHPSFTFLMNPANPDFKRIKDNNFDEYYYETFKETLSKRYDGGEIYNWYKKAIEANLIEVGFHGREHLNVNSWMDDLKRGHEVVLDGFNNKIWGQGVLLSKQYNSYRSSFQMKSYDELDFLRSVITDGVAIMNKMFNQKTTYFLAPDGPFHLKLNSALKSSGIKYIGLAKLHTNPLENKKYQKKLFWKGKRTKEGLLVITRNVIFEPASPKSVDWVQSALKSIESAFKFNKPAVISTHRANYVGSLNIENRIFSFKQLETLLEKILEQWPDVEFKTSSQLGNLIAN